MRASCFFTPRIIVHRCKPSTTTATPFGSRSSCSKSAICWVMRSCTCSRRAKISTSRGNLGKADHLSGWHVGHMHAAQERQHVMLAQAVKLDIADDHHLVIADIEQGSIDDLFRICAVAAEQFCVHACNTPRGIEQAFPFRLFSQSRQELRDWLPEQPAHPPAFGHIISGHVIVEL